MKPTFMLITSCSVTLVLLISYGYLYISEKKSYILTWIFSLFSLLLSYFSRLTMWHMNRETPLLLIINYTATVASYLFIYIGISVFFHTRHSGFWVLTAVAASIIYAVAVLAGLPVKIILLCTVFLSLALLANSGFIVLRASKPRGSIRKMLGITMLLWAAALLLYIVSNVTNQLSINYSYLFAGVFGLITYINMQAMYFQCVREDLEQKESNIRRLLIYDKLTDAYNRTFMEEILEGFPVKFTLPVSIAMGDVNGLKLINDTFGHNKGDELLIDAVKIMKASIGDESIIIRRGGDEFMIIMPCMTMEEAEEVIFKIKSSCKNFCPKTIPVDISFGLATVSHTDSVDDVIKQAEDKMYGSKLYESKRTRLAIIEFLEKLLLEKDYQTEEHVMRLRELVIRFGRYIGLPSREIEDLSQVAMLHDIGKIGVPAEILNKAGPLEQDEWSIMKKHPEIGYRITQSSRELAHISEAILGHHEWWNGNGYPQGLRGEEIPVYSRIVSILDSFDVMTHIRPYKDAVDVPEALDEIERCSGTQYDPVLAESFIKMMRKCLVSNL